MGGLVVPPGLRWAGLGVVLVGSAALPGLLSPTNLTVYINACLIILVTTGLTLLMGYAGQFSAGQIAFMVVGGYVTAVLSVHGWPTVVALIAGPVAAAVIAAGIGIPILRLRANYLAFATMAVQLILLNLIGNSPYLGGGSGLVGIPLLGVGAWKIHSLQGYAWLSWAAVVLVVGMTANLIRSRPGRALRALASSEVAAEAAGVAVIRYKIVVFAISAAYAGLAGSIFAFFMGSVNPDAFPLSLSIESIVMVIIGGLGSISGGVLGSLVIVLLLQGLNVLGSAPGMSPTMPVVLSYAVYGVLLMAVVLLLPDGLLRAVTQGLARWGRPQPAVAYPAARDEARV
ncbi:MAG: branched-chain amino acid ABC transporter permease [Firmicutes bacterium]|nr:branched-chain amino acid ABC transporter permease [Alicyclobacillaceae bacterium]MCL6498295.1 branched-chain amino acid ABC transporter permease [Bacillota bacterium]